MDRLLNLIVAPTVFRILFAAAPLQAQELQELVDIALGPACETRSQPG